MNRRSLRKEGWRRETDDKIKPKGLYIPRVILTDSQLEPSQKIVYSAMLAAMDDRYVCRQTAAELGKPICMTVEAVTHNRRKLCQLGYIERIDRTSRNYLMRRYKEAKEKNHAPEIHDQRIR